MGRAVHIHVKVHTGGEVVHTGQLFFDDALTSSVYAANAPYNIRPVADTTDGTDMIYQEAGASEAIPEMKKQGAGIWER